MYFKKATFIAAILGMALFLSVTAAEACPPGCPCDPPGATPPNSSVTQGGKLGIIQARADANRVRDKAYAQQITKQNDNAVGMTCFDNAISLTGHLGEIFSDDLTAPPEGPNEAVFGTVLYPDFGSQQILLEQIKDVIETPMMDHAGNFANSLSHMLGATSLTSITASFMGPLNAYIGQVLSVMGNLMAEIANLINLMNLVVAAIEALGGQTPLILTALFAILEAAQAALEFLASNVIGAILTTIQGFIDTLLATVMGLLSDAMTAAFSGLLGAFNPCERLAGLWGDGFDLTGLTQILAPFGQVFKPLVGGGIEANTSYFSFQSLVDAVGTGSGTIPGIGNSQLLSEIMNPTNSGILQQAYNHLNNELSQPGVLPTWTVPPVLPAAVDVNGILGAL